MKHLYKDLKKKISSTKFVYMVAKSGTGKSFSGDYLGAIRGWKHIDGDIPYKYRNQNPEYKNASDQMTVAGKYADMDEEWKQNESGNAYMKILARLALEGARDSNNHCVVLTHATGSVQSRIFLRQQLEDAGAKDVSVVFLHCDFEARMQALWKRYIRVANKCDMTIEDFFQLPEWGGAALVVDFGSFVEFYKDFFAFADPDESEKPYKVVDVTAKDVTVLDSLDETFGIDKNTSRGDLSYEEMVLEIRAIDEKRDQDRTDSESALLAETEPEEMAARRSSLIELDKLDAFRRSSDRSSVLLSESRRASFIATGRFEE